MAPQMHVVRERAISTQWAPEAETVREGILQVWGNTAEYRVLQPAPTQWVIMALISCDPGASRRLVVTVGRSEIEALTRLARHLRQPGPSYSNNAFATEWAMSELSN